MSQEVIQPGADPQKLQEHVLAAQQIAKGAGMVEVVTVNAPEYREGIIHITDEKSSGVEIHNTIDLSSGISHQVMDAETIVPAPTISGEVHYRASNYEDSRGRNEDAITRIVRTDKEGNEVYRHRSTNPRLARQVGVVAAHNVAKSAASKTKLAA